MSISQENSIWCPKFTPIQTFQPILLPDHQAGVHSTFPRKSPTDALSSYPFTCPSRMPFEKPCKRPIKKPHPQNTLPQTLPDTIKYTHFHSFHLLHLYSISHMGYTRPLWWPHGSHCTRHQGCIPLPVPVPDIVVHTVVRRD